MIYLTPVILFESFPLQWGCEWFYGVHASELGIRGGWHRKAQGHRHPGPSKHNSTAALNILDGDVFRETDVNLCNFHLCSSFSILSQQVQTQSQCEGFFPSRGPLLFPSFYSDQIFKKILPDLLSSIPSSRNVMF